MEARFTGTAVIVLLGLAAYEAATFAVLCLIVPGATGGEIHCPL